uniref:Uncharacterized protein n=1 Tax=Opuntia streptacantha TaxID=393608 RepID=A0A7C9EF51_OPUST
MWPPFFCQWQSIMYRPWRKRKQRRSVFYREVMNISSLPCGSTKIFRVNKLRFNIIQEARNSVPDSFRSQCYIFIIEIRGTKGCIWQRPADRRTRLSGNTKSYHWLREANWLIILKQCFLLFPLVILQHPPPLVFSIAAVKLWFRWINIIRICSSSHLSST